jgi:hypothetical protein
MQVTPETDPAKKLGLQMTLLCVTTIVLFLLATIW